MLKMQDRELRDRRKEKGTVLCLHGTDGGGQHIYESDRNHYGVQPFS